MGRSTPSWIKRGALLSHATVLHATVLHATVLHTTVLHATVLHATVLHTTVLHTTVLPAIAAPGRRQCAQAGDSAVKAHSSALHAKDAPICLRLIDSFERGVRASLALGFVLSRSK